MKTETEKPKNRAACSLGKLARGIPKTLTPAERKRRAEVARNLAKTRKPRAAK